MRGDGGFDYTANVVGKQLVRVSIYFLGEVQWNSKALGLSNWKCRFTEMEKTLGATGFERENKVSIRDRRCLLDLVEKSSRYLYDSGIQKRYKDFRQQFMRCQMQVTFETETGYSHLEPNMDGYEKR